MATRKKNGNSANLSFEATLWAAADKLRNNMDAAEYEHVVLGLGNVKQLRVLIPRGDVAREYEAVATSLHERIVTNEKESITLAQIRDALLPKLLSGEIRVGAAEREVAEGV